MTVFTIQGKEFRYPEEIVNQRTVDIFKLEKEHGVMWIANEEAINKMMRSMLDGPHDDVDWLQVTQKETKAIYKGFFTDYATKMNESSD